MFGPFSIIHLLSVWGTWSLYQAIRFARAGNIKAHRGTMRGLYFGGVIVAEATLSFLGLGPSDGVSWGALLDQGSGVLLRFPHVALVAGSAIALTVLGFNLSGDDLRDRLDPRLRGG